VFRADEDEYSVIAKFVRCPFERAVFDATWFALVYFEAALADAPASAWLVTSSAAAKIAPVTASLLSIVPSI
jgi:hypothetical protein